MSQTTIIEEELPTGRDLAATVHTFVKKLDMLIEDPGVIERLPVHVQDRLKRLSCFLEGLWRLHDMPADKHDEVISIKLVDVDLLIADICDQYEIDRFADRSTEPTST